MNFSATILLNYFDLIPWQLIAVPLMIGLVITALGAFNVQWNFFLNAIHQGDTSNRQIALTFDDGPHPIYTKQVLALLKKHGVQATFFCIGRRVLHYPELIKELDEQAHIIGNHSFTHAATIDFHSKAQWLEELRKTDAAIADTIGKKPLFFRPPYGVTTPHLAKTIKKSGHLAIGWRVRPYDTRRQQPASIIRKILHQIKAGDIILLHDTHERIVPVLEQLLPELKKRNFTMVTVEKLIRRNAYAQL
ncbi:polysaccharide deacetylase family protein [Parapedobacter tibetensis]|uniref:polysaccharide deacetylase family protein n=1 Tax=Parapedobacter tibetensis TaxID=2972951 RepID=UPI00214D687F|nr:polysaccharide deacetylase family protein [Parapedobacter tibetensis]